MTTLLGPRALMDLVVPTGVDTGEIFKWELRDGLTAEQVMAMAATIIGEKNQSLLDQYGGMLTTTQSQWTMTRQGQGGRTETPEWAEFSVPDGIRTDMIGNMLPLAYLRDAVSWSAKWLKEANTEMVRNDLLVIGDRLENYIDRVIWTRALTTTENAIGSAGYDVPWVHTTSGSVDYIPPQHGQFEFASTHDHFIWKDDDSTSWSDVLISQQQTLLEHGLTGPHICWFSYSDIDEVEVIDGFVEMNPYLVLPSGADNPRNPMYMQPGAHQGVPGEKFGNFKSLYGTVELRWHNRIPTNYSFMTKSFGVNHPNNGLAFRIHPAYGFGMSIDPQVTKSIVPELDMILFPFVGGIGVNDRINGAPGYLLSAASAWVDPTIS